MDDGLILTLIASQYFVGILIVWIICAIAAGIVADNKGRNGVLWGLLTFLLTPLLLIIVLVLQPVDLRPRSPDSNTGRYVNRPQSVISPNEKSRADPSQLATNLEKLVEIYKQGHLTDEEFSKAKARLIEGDYRLGGLISHPTETVQSNVHDPTEEEDKLKGKFETVSVADQKDPREMTPLEVIEELQSYGIEVDAYAGGPYFIVDALGHSLTLRDPGALARFLQLKRSKGVE